VAGMDGTHDALAQFHSDSSHADHSLPEQPSIPPALSFRKPL
jgi:hypothetical protein